MTRFVTNAALSKLKSQSSGFEKYQVKVLYRRDKSVFNNLRA